MSLSFYTDIIETLVIKNFENCTYIRACFQLNIFCPPKLPLSWLLKVFPNNGMLTEAEKYFNRSLWKRLSLKTGTGTRGTRNQEYIGTGEYRGMGERRNIGESWGTKEYRGMSRNIGEYRGTKEYRGILGNGGISGNIGERRNIEEYRGISGNIEEYRGAEEYRGISGNGGISGNIIFPDNF